LITARVVPTYTKPVWPCSASCRITLACSASAIC
jgi:hypothetical protein